MLCVCELFPKQFAIGLVVVVILLLNVMKLFSVGGGSLLDRLDSESILNGTLNVKLNWLYQ